MFSLIQETESGQKIWPGISHVCTSEEAVDCGPRNIRTVTALFDRGGVMDFPASRKKHNIYVMNESGATVAKYYIGNNPRAPEPAGALPEGPNPPPNARD